MEKSIYEYGIMERPWCSKAGWPENVIRYSNYLINLKNKNFFVIYIKHQLQQVQLKDLWQKYMLRTNGGWNQCNLQAINRWLMIDAFSPKQQSHLFAHN